MILPAKNRLSEEMDNGFPHIFPTTPASNQPSDAKTKLRLKGKPYLSDHL